MKKYFKLYTCCFLIVHYLILAFIGKLLLRTPQVRRRFYLKYVKLHSRLLMRVMGIEITVENPERIRTGKTHMILANHMSYLDPLVLFTIEPACFVTSMEIRETPVLGLICELGGCLFVERRDRSNISNEIGQIIQGLQEGFHVAIFPEATSTNGSAVLPFKRALLTAAVQAQKNLLPMVIHYEEIDGEKVTSKNRDELCWYGDMPFGPHFSSLMARNKIKIRVTILPEIPIKAESTRDTLVDQAYAAISGVYQKIL